MGSACSERIHQFLCQFPITFDSIDTYLKSHLWMDFIRLQHILVLAHQSASMIVWIIILIVVQLVEILSKYIYIEFVISKDYNANLKNELLFKTTSDDKFLAWHISAVARLNLTLGTFEILSIIVIIMWSYVKTFWVRFDDGRTSNRSDYDYA